MLHDRPYHLAQRWITYRRRYAAGDLFLGLYRPSRIDKDVAPDAVEENGDVVSPFEIMRAFPARRPAAHVRLTGSAGLSASAAQ